MGCPRHRLCPVGAGQPPPHGLGPLGVRQRQPGEHGDGFGDVLARRPGVACVGRIVPGFGGFGGGMSGGGGAGGSF